MAPGSRQLASKLAAEDLQEDPLGFPSRRIFLYPVSRGQLGQQRAAFLCEAEAKGPKRLLRTPATMFKRLTAEEREELETMKSSRFDQQDRASSSGSGSKGDNGDAVPLGFLTSVPGVSTLAGSSYVLSAVEYAKENPLTALWTVGPAVCSVVVSAGRSAYNYFYPQEQSWLGGWDAGLLGSAGASWFGTSAAAGSSWWPGSQPQASSGWFGFGSQAPASSSWFGGESAASSSSWFGAGSSAGGAAAAGAATGGWFGGLFGGGDQKARSSNEPAATTEGEGEGGFDLGEDLDMDFGGDDDEGCEQQ